MSSSVSNNAMFSGNSRYANDFQQVISRAVAIASLPLKMLQSGLTTLQDQSTGLGTLNTKLSSLQSAIQGIGTATGGSSYGVSVSDSAVSASVATGVLPGAYTVEVADLGSYNNTMSVDSATPVKDPSRDNISTRTNFTLTAEGKTFTFSAANLNDMVTKINGSGLSVQASAVNVGSKDAPDYRLSVQGTKLGGLGVSLTDDSSPTPNQLLNTLSAGTKAAYKVNGYAVAATSDSRTVEVAPGLTVTLAQMSAAGTPSTITVSRKADSVKNALSSFVTAYNAAVDEVDKNRGQGNGVLAGQSIVYSADQALSRVQGYAPGSGPFSSLEDLGVSVDRNGHLTLDSSTFDKAANGHIEDVMSFLGSAGGGGFLKSATDALNQLEDPVTGQVQTALSAVNSQIASQNDRISEEQNRIDALQLSLNGQMAAADALIASLEQQATYMSNLFQAMLSSNSSNR